MKASMLPSKEEFASELKKHSDEDFARIYYCFYLGNAFVQLHLLEQSTIDALQSCRKLDEVLGVHVTSADGWMAKQDLLRKSTLGSLLTYLEKAGVSATGLSYLRYLKRQRDLLVHNFFHFHAWPGELCLQDAEVHVRRLRFFEIVFSRGAHRIWKVMSDSGLFVRIDLGPNGALICNPDLFPRMTRAEGVRNAL